jgi:hypothetical protein
MHDILSRESEELAVKGDCARSVEADGFQSFSASSIKSARLVVLSYESARASFRSSFSHSSGVSAGLIGSVMFQI